MRVPEEHATTFNSSLLIANLSSFSLIW